MNGSRLTMALTALNVGVLLLGVAQHAGPTRLGLVFFLAYAASSLWQLLRGRRAYWDNHFEVEARARASARENPLRPARVL